MRSKPMAENGPARLEAIREQLGINQSEMSLALGYKTTGGYNATCRLNRVTEQIILAAEGLLARHKPNGTTPPSKVILVMIAHDGTVTSRPLPEMVEITLGGKTFNLLPVE